MWVIGAVGSEETLQHLPEPEHAKVLAVTAIRFETVAFQLPDEPVDWVFFGSKRGVKAFFEEAGGLPEGVSVGAVGTRTAKVLSAFGVQADFVPTRFSSTSWPEEFVACFPSARHVLMPTSDRSVMKTPAVFADRGIRFTRLVCYRTCCAEIELRSLGHLDALVFASPSSVDCFMRQLGVEYLEGKCLVAIGDVTAGRLRELGFSSAMPDRYTMADAVQQAVHLLDNGKRSDM